MFRFTIRELLLVTVVVGMGVGWWLDRHPIVRGVPVPSDDDVIQAWKLTGSTAPVLAEKKANTLRITKDKIADYSDQPINGVATWHNRYKCTIDCQQAGVEEVVYVDKTGFRPAPSP